MKGRARLLPRRWRRGNRRRAADAGMVTAEVALALPALVIVAAALIGVIVAVAAQLRCVAAAREGARAAARGEPADVVQQLATSAAPDGATVSVSSGGDTVTVVVTASVTPLGIRLAQIEVSGEATAQREPTSDDLDTNDAGGAAGLAFAWFALGRRRGGRRSELPVGRWWIGERGSGTVYVVAMIGVLAVLAGGAILVAKAFVAHQRASAAADLGALAGAQVLLDGDGDPCATAASIVQRNDAELADCVIEGETVVITARVPVSLGGLGIRDATSTARAGPVDTTRMAGTVEWTRPSKSS